MRLKELREKNGYTQKHLADVLGVAQNTYSQYETGICSISIDSLIKLSELYDTSVDYIIGNSDNPYKY